MTAANDGGKPRVAVLSEFRVELHPERGPVTRTPFGHDYWANVFDTPLSITLIVRGDSVQGPHRGDDLRSVVGPDVDVVVLPPLRPSLRLVTEVPKALRALWAIDRDIHWLLRMPGIVPSLGLLVLTCRRQPFAVQVVGDPVDLSLRAGIGGRLAPIVGLILGTATWVGCRRATVAAYVTEKYLQRRYPPRRGSPVHAFSDVRLEVTTADFNSLTSREVDSAADIMLVTVASLEAPYKRVDLLLQAVAMLREEGWQVCLDVVGGGAYLSALQKLAESLRVGLYVRFRGMLGTAELSALLANSDVFVLCSDTEGMPRALLEAMAIGLPCVATAVGGVPEVLPAEALCRPGSLDSLVAGLRRNLVSTQLRQRNAEACARRIEQFRPEVLGTRRKAFVDDLGRYLNRPGGSPRLETSLEPSGLADE